MSENKDIAKPDLENLTPLDAFYHIFTVEQHPYESDAEYRERCVVRETFITTLEDNGMTPSEYLAQLQSRYGKQ